MSMGQWLGVLSLVASLYILWQVRQLVLLIFTAIVLATVINALVRQLQQFQLKRGWAILASLGLILSLLIGVFWLIVPRFIEQFEDLVNLLPIGLIQLQKALTWLEDQILGPYFPSLPDLNELIQNLQPLGTTLMRRTIALLSNSVSAFLETLLVLVLTLMFLLNPQPYRQVLIRLFPAFYRPRVNAILDRCASALEHWAVGALIEMVFVGVLSGLGLWLLQVPLALAHAVLAGLLNFIPNIGPTLSVFIPMAIALLDAPWKAVAVLILYIAIQNLESYWLTPTVMAQQVALLPAITLTAQIFFTTIFGALGLLMALPLAVVAKTWIEELLFKDLLDRWQHPPSRRVSSE